jgi:hypothetical protein
VGSLVIIVLQWPLNPGSILDCGPGGRLGLFKPPNGLNRGRFFDEFVGDAGRIADLVVKVLDLCI